MIDDIIKSIEPKAQEQYAQTKYKRINTEGRKADNRLKACPDCDVVWELNWYERKEHRKHHYFTYNNFPRFGKEKVVCPPCLKKKHYCDLCEAQKHRSQVEKSDGIWVCDPCDKKYPKKEK